MSIDKFLFSSPILRVLERSMDVEAKRVEVAASNLANIETPRYRAMEVDFKNVFENEVSMIDPEVPVATHPKHIGVAMDGEGASSIRIKEREDGAKRVDGNTVDMDFEMANLAQAQLQYYASVTALSRKLGMIAQALSSRLT